MGDTRLPEAMTDVMRILAAGINVVGSSPGLLQYPWGVMPDKYIARVEDAARQGNSSIFISGVDPGFANDLIPFALAGTCQRIESVDILTFRGSLLCEANRGIRVEISLREKSRERGRLRLLFLPSFAFESFGFAIRSTGGGGIAEVPRDVAAHRPDLWRVRSVREQTLGFLEA